MGVRGMGEVYGATDTKLKREVASKVLPCALVTFSLRQRLPVTRPRSGLRHLVLNWFEEPRRLVRTN